MRENEKLNKVPTNNLVTKKPPKKKGLPNRNPFFVKIDFVILFNALKIETNAALFFYHTFCALRRDCLELGNRPT